MLIIYQVKALISPNITGRWFAIVVGQSSILPYLAVLGSTVPIPVLVRYYLVVIPRRHIHAMMILHPVRPALF